jgi:hypothetical protein
MSTSKPPPVILPKDKIVCFICSTRNIEKTFNSYYDLQDHLYKDHEKDMKKDPAMEIFNKYNKQKDTMSTPTSTSNSTG